jgi:2-polyprenyl-6-methoxyphenol hydroxylase-like FAD-dependent oxidoreductase
LKARTVLISGAGVAGLALAYWLRRHGFRPTVVERAPGPRAGGYKIDLRGAAVGVVKRMGVLPEVLGASIHMRTASWVDDAGRRVATLPADFFEARDADNIELLRDDLVLSLQNLTRHQVEYRFDDSIVALTDGPDGVTVDFERGERRKFDLVLGADGVRSRVRWLAFGDDAHFVDDLGGYYVTSFTVPNALRLDREDLFHHLPDKTLNVSSLSPDAPARVVFLFASPPLSYDRADVDAQKNLVAGLFSDAGWEVPGWVQTMRGAADFYLDSVSQVRMDRWSRGRVALVGDAAYAPCLASGQGTSLALVGAYVLAGELHAAGGDPAVAFPRYEEKMRDYVELNQRLGRDGLNAMVLRWRWQIALLVLVLRVMHWMPWRGLLSRRLKRVVQRAACAIELCDYESGVHGARTRARSRHARASSSRPANRKARASVTQGRA